jgi:hypothetical protein
MEACKVCGTLFEKSRRTQTTCGPACWATIVKWSSTKLAASRGARLPRHRPLGPPIKNTTRPEYRENHKRQDYYQCQYEYHEHEEEHHYQENPELIMGLTRTCEVCGAVFLSCVVAQATCSVKCSLKLSRRKIAAYAFLRREMKICAVCGIEFLAVQSTTITCGKVCSNRKSSRDSARRRGPGRKRHEKRRRLRSHILIVEWFENHPCVDCGEKDVRILEADHLEYFKKHNISDLVHTNKTKELCEELKVCESRCVKCHRKKTLRFSSNTKPRPRHIVKFFNENPCACGETDQALLDFDHECKEEEKNERMRHSSPTRKHPAGFKSLNKKAFAAEVTKGTVRCCHCHRIRHFEEMGSYRTKTSQQLRDELAATYSRHNPANILAKESA